jgi:hypothetical protein
MLTDINTELQYLAQEHYDALADMQYDEMMEAMYGSDPRWHGTDWDWNEGLWYWEKK